MSCARSLNLAALNAHKMHNALLARPTPNYEMVIASSIAVAIQTIKNAQKRIRHRIKVPMAVSETDDDSYIYLIFTKMTTDCFELDQKFSQQLLLKTKVIIV